MTIRYERQGNVAWATFGRPEVLNAFDIADLEELLAVLRSCAADDTVRVLVLSGTGRAFSAGADIKAMAAMDDADFATAAALYQALAIEARQLDKPIIGAINGYALGGGLEIALMCDLRVAARSATFGLPDAELGFSPTGGLTHVLGRVIGLARALDMAMTGEIVDATEAERIGLVSRVVDDGSLQATVGELAARIAAFPAGGLRYIKRAFYFAGESSFAASLDLEESYDADRFRSQDTRDLLAAFVASRGNKSKG